MLLPYIFPIRKALSERNGGNSCELLFNANKPRKVRVNASALECASKTFCPLSLLAFLAENATFPNRLRALRLKFSLMNAGKLSTLP